MSTVVVLAPLVVAGWPAITAAVTAAIGAMGFTLAKSTADLELAERDVTTRAEIEVEDSEILQEAGGSGQQIVIERDSLRAVFSRDARGALRVCMEGKGYTKAQLTSIGQELLGRVTQQFVYHRIVTELKQRNMAIVDEEVTQDRTVKIRVRNY